MGHFPAYEPPPTDSAFWIVDEIRDEANLQGQPLSDAEVALLKASVFEVIQDESNRPVAFALNNRLVPLIRGRIERVKGLKGVELARVRRGLRIPTEWNHHYSVIYRNEVDWFVSPVMQNVMMKNDWAGEKKPWKSR